MVSYKYHMNTALFMYKYAVRVIPEAKRLFDEMSIKPEAERTAKEQYDDSSDKTRSGLDLRCYSLFALYPGLDNDNAISFIAAFHALTDYIGGLCQTNNIPDEAAVRRLYQALQDAVDPERTTGGYRLSYSLKDGKELIRLVNQCRLRIIALPSYTLVTGKMKKYVLLYIDLQSYRYLPHYIRREYIETWADSYLRRYRGVSFREFSAAASSLLGVFSMFASASDPRLTSGDVMALDEVYFPWVCGLHKLLEAYISAREDILTDQLNFTSCYGNLRICEERLSFFIDTAYKICAALKNPEYHISLVKCLLSLYLSDPRAYFGMYRLASRKIINNSPLSTNLYWKAFKLLRRISVL